MIFDAILKANKALQKNVANRTFFITTLVGIMGTLYTGVLHADLISVPLSHPVTSGIFYDTSYFGISSHNTLNKHSVTGQHFWSIPIKEPPIKKLQATFNRLAILNENGELECRDSVFGILLWKSELSNIQNILFQYPISYALLTNGTIIPFDFNSGVQLGRLSSSKASPPIQSIRPTVNGITVLGRNNITEIPIDRPEYAIADPLEDGYQVLSLSPRIIVAIGNLITEKKPTQTVDLFAMGGLKNTIHYYENQIISIKPPLSNSSSSEWIAAYPYLIEATIGYSMIRVIDIESLETILEWKEIDPDRHWKSIWWDHGLLAVLDMNQMLTVWDSASKRTLGSVSWDRLNDIPIGMIYTHEVLSFISTESISYAFSRK